MNNRSMNENFNTHKTAFYVQRKAGGSLCDFDNNEGGKKNSFEP